MSDLQTLVDDSSNFWKGSEERRRRRRETPLLPTIVYLTADSKNEGDGETDRTRTILSRAIGLSPLDSVARLRF
jgi:hypothetical protein